MSAKQIVRDPDIRRLIDDGYEIEVLNGHLLAHIPYVNSRREVQRGIVVTNLNGNVGALGAPSDHQVWFVGEYPCHHTGTPIEAIRHTSGPYLLWDGFTVQHRFSNKPSDGYPDFYSKMSSYIAIISNEATALDPAVTARTFRAIPASETDTVFRYWDSASSRANIMAATDKLAAPKVAIVGLGGTGSYVLDLVAKTPTWEIHLFDGDVLEPHNAFRAPGAVPIGVLEKRPPKVAYFKDVYDAMHPGIVPHHVYITDDNLHLLDDFSFVFICVDKGPVRRLIGTYLREKQLVFVDVGMELEMLPEETSIIGTCRATLCTPDRHEHFDRCAPQHFDAADELYRSNIQVADMNAMNACLAVMMWKQHVGFYQNIFKAHHLTYSVNVNSLTRSEMAMPSDGDT